MALADPYPRKLRPRELDLLEGVLPSDRPGYRHYRELIHTLMVLAEGQRGPGNYLLGRAGTIPDLSVPMGPVVAFGIVETVHATFTITIREQTGEQIDIEIVSGTGTEVPDHFEEKRRWSYSTWLPGMPSPATGASVREVSIDPSLTLVVAPGEKRLWLYDRGSGMNHLLPVTNFHNDLMLHKGIRDPKIALDIGHFFSHHAEYADDDLCKAFIKYNAPRHRVSIEARSAAPPAKGLMQTLKRLFGKERDERP